MQTHDSFDLLAMDDKQNNLPKKESEFEVVGSFEWWQQTYF